MRSENLNQGDFECRNFSMHEDTSEVKLYLETDIDVSTINGWRPPKCESAVRNLSQTSALCICQFFTKKIVCKLC